MNGQKRGRASSQPHLFVPHVVADTTRKVSHGLHQTEPGKGLLLHSTCSTVIPTHTLALSVSGLGPLFLFAGTGSSQTRLVAESSRALNVIVSSVREKSGERDGNIVLEDFEEQSSAHFASKTTPWKTRSWYWSTEGDPKDQISGRVDAPHTHPAVQTSLDGPRETAGIVGFLPSTAAPMQMANCGSRAKLSLEELRR